MRVQVIKVDMERRQVDLGIVEILDRVRESERNRGARRNREGREGRDCFRFAPVHHIGQCVLTEKKDDPAFARQARL